MADFTALNAEIQRNTDLRASIKAAFAARDAAVEAAKADQVNVDSALAALKANDDDLASAVIANTPAAPVVP